MSEQDEWVWATEAAKELGWQPYELTNVAAPLGMIRKLPHDMRRNGIRRRDLERLRQLKATVRAELTTGRIPTP